MKNISFLFISATVATATISNPSSSAAATTIANNAATEDIENTLTTPKNRSQWSITYPIPEKKPNNDIMNSITPDTEDLTFVFHGAGGQDVNTDNLMSHLIQSKKKKKENVVVAMVDWSELSKDLFKASLIGEQVGRDMATWVSKKTSATTTNKLKKNVHVLGISVGAFAADSFVSRLKEEEEEEEEELMGGVDVKLTLLDPFTWRGRFDFRYGVRNFGKTADFAEHFLNTDDPVPSTNTPVRNCAVTDVTSLRPEGIFGHDWPLIYYTEHLSSSDEPSVVAASRGSVVVL